MPTREERIDIAVGEESISGTFVNPATVMPSYYRIDGMDRVASNYAGKPVLTAQQVEDVVAWLITLK